MLIIDSRMRIFEKNKLKELGYDLFEIIPNPNLYYEISAHPDIHCTKIKDKIICDSYINIPNSIIGKTILKNKYPLDIAYNICITNNTAIHNFKHTEKKILEKLDELNYKKININQGYSKCSISVITDNSLIVTDSKIADILMKNNFEVLLISQKVTENIHLYKNSNLEYSNMTGFIGGVISRIDDFVFISGDLNFIDKNNEIRNFIEKKNLKIIEFLNYDIIDYGGIIKI